MSKNYKKIQDYEEEVRNKSETLNVLMKANEQTETYHIKTKEMLAFLCEAKPNLNIKLAGTKICHYCREDFNHPQEEKCITACQCFSFHKTCLLRTCKGISTDLEDFALVDLRCGECNRNINLNFIKKTLGDVYENEINKIMETKNRKVKCLICGKVEKFDQMFERHCGHGFCPSCFKNHLENIIKKKKGNIREFICPVPDCKFQVIEFSELKTFVTASIMNDYDMYLEKIFDPKKLNNIVFKCKNENCYEIKVTNFECKDAEYKCLKCEDNEKNQDKQE